MVASNERVIGGHDRYDSIAKTYYTMAPCVLICVNLLPLTQPPTSPLRRGRQSLQLVSLHPNLLPLLHDLPTHGI